MTRTLLCCFFDIFFPFVARDRSPSLREGPFSVFNQHDIPFPCGQQNKPRHSLRESTKRSRSAHSLYGDKRGLPGELLLTGGKTPRTSRIRPCSASLRRRRTERGGLILWPFSIRFCRGESGSCRSAQAPILTKRAAGSSRRTRGLLRSRTEYQLSLYIKIPLLSSRWTSPSLTVLRPAEEVFSSLSP